MRHGVGVRGRQREPDGVGHRQPGQRVDQPEPDRRPAEPARRLAALGVVGLQRRPGRLRPTAGSNSNPLPSPVQSLLGTVNGILPANLALNPTSVAGGSDVSGECSVLSGLLTQLDAASGTSPVTGLVTGILNQVLGLTGGNAVSVQPLSIDLGGSTSSVSTSGNVVTDSVTPAHRRRQPLRPGRPAGGADHRLGRARPQHRHGDAQLQRRPRLLLDQRLAADVRQHHAADQPGQPDPGAGRGQQRAGLGAGEPPDRDHRLQPRRQPAHLRHLGPRHDGQRQGGRPQPRPAQRPAGRRRPQRRRRQRHRQLDRGHAGRRHVARHPATPAAAAAPARRPCPASPACTPASSGPGPCPSS